MNRINPSRMLPIRDEVYNRIRKAILCGDYKPGERLQEEQLAKELGISRTPVREALRKLEVENIVIHFPHRGTVVAGLSTDEVEELYEIRTLIDVFIIKRATENAAPEDIAKLHHLLDLEENETERDKVNECIDAYNTAILDLAACPSLADLGAKVRDKLSRMIISGHLHPERRPIAQREHREIVNAMAKGDSDLAQSLTITHLRNASRVLREYPDSQQAKQGQ